MISRFIAREQLAISSAAKNLDADGADTLFTLLNRNQIKYADIDVQDDDVYVTFDGSTTPSTSAGEIWYKGQKYRIWGMQNILNVQFIRVTGDAVLDISYWGE